MAVKVLPRRWPSGSARAAGLGQRLLQAGDGVDLAVAQVRLGRAGIARAGGERRVSGCAASPATSAGWKKWNSSRERGHGSLPSVKRMIWPCSQTGNARRAVLAPFEIGSGIALGLRFMLR